MSSNQFFFKEKLEGVVWGTIISANGDSLVVDVRNVENQEVQYFQLFLESFQLALLPIAGSNWWSKMEAFDGSLTVSEYQDKNDPNEKLFFRWEDGVRSPIDNPLLSPMEATVGHPSIYEVGTEYHRTVGDFLSLEIPCSCEYLEFNQKIILSYYLRSNNRLDRHLLVLDQGKKVLKEIQDVDMKGFAPGAFFVLDNKLFFIRNRNEICIHPL